MATRLQTKSKLEYRVRSNTTQAQLDATVSSAWRDALKTNPAVRSALKIPDGARIPARLASHPFLLKRRAGADPLSATLLVALTAAGIKIGTRVVQDIWSKLLLPPLQKKFGAREVKRPNATKDASDPKSTAAARKKKKKKN